jgi:hypothetical protein
VKRIPSGCYGDEDPIFRCLVNIPLCLIKFMLAAVGILALVSNGLSIKPEQSPPLYLRRARSAPYALPGNPARPRAPAERGYVYLLIVAATVWVNWVWSSHNSSALCQHPNSHNNKHAIYRLHLRPACIRTSPGHSGIYPQVTPDADRQWPLSPGTLGQHVDSGPSAGAFGRHVDRGPSQLGPLAGT